jgi:hypothetical protein
MEETELNHCPIYIYAPEYVTWSAGIRVLYKLCHELNKNGFKSWIVLHGPRNSKRIDHGLIAPVLNKKIAIEHERQNLRSIAIYPETIPGNPLNAAFTIRWLLNVPGQLGGNTKFKDELVLSYTDYLAQKYLAFSGRQTDILFIPAVDKSELSLVQIEKRNLIENQTLLYCQKFRALGGEPSLEHKSAIEVTRFKSNSWSRQDLLIKLQNSSELIAYENTTLISEAQFFGVPVRCISNNWFDGLIAEKELGSDGVCWNEETKMINLSISATAFKEKLETAQTKVASTLGEMAPKWNQLAELKQATRLKVPKNHIISKHSIDRAVLIFRTMGVGNLLRFGARYIYRGVRTKISQSI